MDFPIKSNMVSSDEDFELFLSEFGDLLRKYHYAPRNKICMVKLRPNHEVAGFSADGKFMWALVGDKDTLELYHTNYETKDV